MKFGGNMMESFLSFLQTFFKLFLELSVLFIFISFLVSWLQQKVTEDRINRVLDRPNKWSGYLYGTGLGALTACCSCSTIPILAGLLSSIAPFGPSMSFLIGYPLLNHVIIVFLWTLLGWKLTLIYAVVVGIVSMLNGVIWEVLGIKHSVKDVTVRKSSSSNEQQNVSKWQLALQDAWSFFYPLLPY